MAHEIFKERRLAISRLLAVGVKPEGDLIKKLSIAFACRPKGDLRRVQAEADSLRSSTAQRHTSSQG